MDSWAELITGCASREKP